MDQFNDVFVGVDAVLDVDVGDGYVICNVVRRPEREFRRLPQNLEVNFSTTTTEDHPNHPLPICRMVSGSKLFFFVPHTQCDQ